MSAVVPREICAINWDPSCGDRVGAGDRVQLDEHKEDIVN